MAPPRLERRRYSLSGACFGLPSVQGTLSWGCMGWFVFGIVVLGVLLFGPQVLNNSTPFVAKVDAWAFLVCSPLMLWVGLWIFRLNSMYEPVVVCTEASLHLHAWKPIEIPWADVCDVQVDSTRSLKFLYAVETGRSGSVRHERVKTYYIRYGLYEGNPEAVVEYVKARINSVGGL